MIQKQEKELIIKNAFEFLKREDLIIMDNNVITYPFEDKGKLENYEVYEMYLYSNNSEKNTSINIVYKTDKRHTTFLYLNYKENQKLTELFDKTYYKLKQKQQQDIKKEEPTSYGELVKASFEMGKTQEQMDKFKEQLKDTTDYTIKCDQNKPKLSQFPREAMEAVVEVMEYGARKYGGGTWNRVEIQRYIDAATRHLYAMQDIDENGKEFINFSKVDEESGLEHLYHLACNVVYAVALYKRGKDETR